MIALLASYLLSLVVLVVVDLSWAGLLMKDFYRARLGHLLAPGVNFMPLVWFYLLLSIGIFYFASYPAFVRHSWVLAACSGALLGIIAYGTYDLTNMATLPSWPLSVTIIDICWGGFVTALTATIGFALLSLFG